MCNSTVTVDTECNKSGNGGICNADSGVCSCNPNFIDGLGQCSVSMGCQNTKACGNGICQGSSCICNSGWYSLTDPCDTKSTPCVSDAYCGHGTCNTTTGQCVCATNWTDKKSLHDWFDIKNRVFINISNSHFIFSHLFCDGCLNDNACGNGRCDGLGSGVCTCTTGWVKGSDHVCDVVDMSCTKNENCGNGVCTNNICVCSPTYGSVAAPCDKVTGDCGSAGYGSYCEHSGVCVLTNKNNPTCTKLGWKREKTDKYLKKAHPLNVSGYKKKLPILSHLPFWILRRPLWICRLLLRKSLSERQRNLCHQREPNSCRVLEYW